MSDDVDKIDKINQRLLKLNQQKAQLRDKQRKRETRHKIELGGLVFTADLNKQLPDLANKEGDARAIILGILAEASDNLHEPAYRASMLNRGRHVFSLKSRANSRARQSE